MKQNRNNDDINSGKFKLMGNLGCGTLLCVFFVGLGIVDDYVEGRKEILMKYLKIYQ